MSKPRLQIEITNGEYDFLDSFFKDSPYGLKTRFFRFFIQTLITWMKKDKFVIYDLLMGKKRMVIEEG